MKGLFQLLLLVYCSISAVARVPDHTTIRRLGQQAINDTIILHVNVLVMDQETNKIIPEALVRLKIANEVSMITDSSGITDAKGEYKFSDTKNSYKGTTIRVIVNKKGYIGNWSDVPSDMMVGKENSERQFLVYLQKKKDCDISVAGKYKTTGDAPGVMILVQTGNNLMGKFGKDDNSLTNTVTGEFNCGAFTGTFTNDKDNKTGKFTCTFAADGKSYTGILKNDADGKSITISGKRE